ncbi:MAG: SPFH domain-containing protein [Chloroflexota bacterium]
MSFQFGNSRFQSRDRDTGSWPHTPLLFGAIVFCILMYWLFWRYFERIDLRDVVPIWSAFLSLPMPGWLIFLREMFHWRVLRHFLPLIVGWYLAYNMAVGLVRVLYELPDFPAARRFLTQLIYTNSASTLPPVTVDSDLLYLKRDQYVVLRIGGPGRIKVRNGYVAVTELNGRFHHILGTGTHTLERFEYVHDVLDLRLQEREAKAVDIISKDGIPINVNIALQFRLATGGESPTRAKPYPYDGAAVRAAAYSQTVREDSTISRWDDAPLGMAKSQLARIVSKHNVDTILTPPEATTNHGIASIPLLSIRNELSYRLKDSFKLKGIELVDVQLSQVELPRDVSSQYIKYWQSLSNARIRLSLADGEATALEEKELAQAEAEMSMIQAILEGVQRAKYANNSANMRDVVALRLVEALEKMARQTQQTTQMPVVPNLLTQIDSFRQQLGDGTPLLEIEETENQEDVNG